MTEYYFNKCSIPREARNAPTLRNAIRGYIDKRLLQVATVCLQCDVDPYRKEFGLIHQRYANMLTLVAEATQDVNYLTKSVIEWVEEDFNSALTGAQKDAAGLCGAELRKIVMQFENR
jgi:hypothetical protein